MAGQYGFVYLLAHEYMPGVYKIGCTERSPHARMADLSSATSIPSPFTMVCYIEVKDMFAVEKKFHIWLKGFRISPNREFFQYGILLMLVSMFRWYGSYFDDHLNFVSVNDESLLCRDWGLDLVQSHDIDPYETQAWDRPESREFTLINDPSMEPF